MPLLHQLLVAFFSCFVSSISAATSADRFSRFENVRDNDVLFTEDIMLQSLARSKLDCGRQCSNQMGCMTFTFTFTKGSPLGSCRGHSSVMSSGRSKTSSVGSRSLILREMLVTCTYFDLYCCWFVCVCVCVCVCVRAPACLRAYMRMCTYVRMCAYVRRCVLIMTDNSVDAGMIILCAESAELSGIVSLAWCRVHFPRECRAVGDCLFGMV